MNNQNTQKSIKKFLAGFGAGIGVILIELLLFAYSEFAAAFGKAMQTSTPSSMILVFVAINFMQNLIVGFLSSVEFAIGFLVGDLLMLVTVGPPMYSVSPAIVLGMIIAFLTVAIALGIRLAYGREQRNTVAW